MESLKNRVTFLTLAHAAASESNPCGLEPALLDRLRQAYYEAYTMLMDGTAPTTQWPTEQDVQLLANKESSSSRRESISAGTAKKSGTSTMTSQTPAKPTKASTHTMRPPKVRR
jgi:hypothetical protein